MDPIVLAAAKGLLQLTAGSIFDLALNNLLEHMGIRAPLLTSPKARLLLDEYLQRLGARLDEDRIAKLHGALQAVKEASKTAAKPAILANAMSIFYQITHLPAQGTTGGQPNAQLRCLAFLGIAAAHAQLNDSPESIATKMVEAIQTDPETAKRWLSEKPVLELQSYYPNLTRFAAHPDEEKNRLRAAASAGKFSLYLEYEIEAQVPTAINPTTVSRGKRLVLRYRIKNNLNYEIPVWLGANLEANRQYHFHATEDADVVLLPGEHTYQRFLTVDREWLPRLYHLQAEVWFGIRAHPESSIPLATVWQNGPWLTVI